MVVSYSSCMHWKQQGLCRERQKLISARVLGKYEWTDGARRNLAQNQCIRARHTVIETDTSRRVTRKVCRSKQWALDRRERPGRRLWEAFLRSRRQARFDPGQVEEGRVWIITRALDDRVGRTFVIAGALIKDIQM